MQANHPVPQKPRTPPDRKPVAPSLYGGSLKCVLIGLLGLVLVPGISQAAGKMELKTEAAKINYSVGYQVGGDFKNQGIALDAEAMVQGIQDAIKHNAPLLTQEEMNAVLVAMKKKIMAKQQTNSRQKSAEYLKASSAFLKENAKKEGVKTLPDGVQYKVLRKGNGKKPTLKDEVKVHYRISRVGGREVGNTYDKNAPRTFPWPRPFLVCRRSCR